MEEDSTIPPVLCITPALSDRQRDMFELSIAYAMVLVVIWTPRPWADLLFCTVILCIVAIIIQGFEGLRPMGLCRGDVSCSLWLVGVSLAMAIVAVAGAEVLHTFHLPSTRSSLIGHTVGYAIWAAIQQMILQCFFLSRLVRVLSSPTLAATVAALLFAGAHLPSPLLTLVTFVCGLAACLFYLRYRSLYPLFAAHAILGGAIAVSVPVQIDHNMNVGLAYLTYSQNRQDIEHHGSRLPAISLTR